MNAVALLDLLLAAGLIGAALSTAGARCGVTGLILCMALLAATWWRLGAVGAALAAIAVAGPGGVLLHAAAGRLDDRRMASAGPRTGLAIRLATGIACAGLTASLAAAVLALPEGAAPARSTSTGAPVVFALCGAALVGIGVFGVVARSAPLSRILAWHVAAAGAALLLGTTTATAMDGAPVPQGMVTAVILVGFVATALAVAFLLRLQETAHPRPARTAHPRQATPGAAATGMG